MTQSPASPEAQTFHRIVEERRSVRDYLPDPVPPQVLERCLDAARKAPSTSNLQPWEFIVIRDPELRKRLDHALMDQRLLETAPLLVAVVAHRDTWKRHGAFILGTLKERGILRRSQTQYWSKYIPVLYSNGPFGAFGLLKKAMSRVGSLFRPVHNLMSRSDLRVAVHKSAALAASTFMLALRAEGYDSCPLEGFDPWRARKLLKLSRRAEVCMFITVGKRGEKAIWWDRILVPREWVVREL